MSVLGEILRGGAEKVNESGAVIVGGHSIQDKEPKYGLAVTGLIHPQKIWKNGGARPGDALILTKPLGIGIISTAIKRGQASREAVDKAVEAMVTLNKTAAEVLDRFNVSGCTDITGFGLLGHSLEMAKASQCQIVLSAAKVPVISETWAYASAGLIPGGSRCNLTAVQPYTKVSPDVGTDVPLVFADAITSGGLLAAVPGDLADDAVTALYEAGVTDASKIGFVSQGDPGTLAVTP